MKLVIDHERYGVRTEFEGESATALIREAQTAIQRCGDEFAHVRLHLTANGRLMNQDGEQVGYSVSW